MSVPHFQNLMLPMLQLAADGQEHRLSDAIDLLAKQLNVSDAEVNRYIVKKIDLDYFKEE